MTIPEIKALLLDEAARAVTHANDFIEAAKENGSTDTMWADHWTARAAALVAAANVLHGAEE